MIFTIGRQYGSGGREVGELLAKELGIPFYDKELLLEAAKDSDYTEEIMDSFDEKPVRTLLYSVAMGGVNGWGAQEMPISVKAFLAQLQTIQRLAEENRSCVFVGRCADYALREKKNVVNAFISADEEVRISRIMEYDNVKEDKARSIMHKIDKTRAGYYNYYTEQDWGAAGNYHLTVNSALIGTQGCVDVIKEFASHVE